MTRKFRFGAGGEGNKEEGGARKFVQLAQTAEEDAGSGRFRQGRHGERLNAARTQGLSEQGCDRVVASDMHAQAGQQSRQCKSGGRCRDQLQRVTAEFWLLLRRWRRRCRWR